MLTYLIITTLLTTLINSGSGKTITRKVNDGTIEMDLLKPTGLKSHIFFEEFGINLFNAIMMIPIFAVVIAIYGFVLPDNGYMVILLFVSIINGAIMIFYYRYILGLFSFWLILNPFVNWYFQTVESLFSGNIVPLWFYPNWLLTITKFLPFRYFMFEPVSIFIGKTPMSEVPNLLMMQFIWIIIFFIIERVIFSKAHKKLIIQGG